MASEPRNEQAVCKQVVRFLEERFRERLRVTAEPDKADRQSPAVELFFESASEQYAMEHTRIESFSEQISDGKAFGDLLEPLEGELDGRLPGHFWLIVPVGATRGCKQSEHAAIRERIRDWIVQRVQKLNGKTESGCEGDFRVTEQPAGVPFPVTLHRARLTGSKLRIFRFSPPDSENLRLERMRVALERKCPKLQAEKENGRTTVLVLESDDIALANRAVIGDAIAQALQERKDKPDYIFLVETEVEPWTIWLMKDRDLIYPDESLQHDFWVDSV